MHVLSKELKFIAINEEITWIPHARHVDRNLCKLENENNQEYYNDDR